MIVLQYIQNTKRRFHTFVANRVCKILECSSPDQWNHVPSASNPADEASRGLCAEDLLQNTRWIKGLDYLWCEPSVWRQQKIVPELCADDSETKRESSVVLQTCAQEAVNSNTSPEAATQEAEVTDLMSHSVTCCNTQEQVVDWIHKLLESYSSWQRLKRAVAWILRLRTILLERVRKQSNSKNTAELTVTEIKAAEIAIVKAVQGKHFPQEIKDLKTGRRVRRTSRICQLDPHLNSTGILCVTGRLQHASVATKSKHQMILPRTSHVTTLIIRHCHQRSGHSGKEYVLAEVRQAFWVIRARRVVNKVLSECVTCKRLHGKPATQRMADLPAERVTAHKPPFTFVGVDAFGPLIVRRGRSDLKRYGCLFTCLSIRAIHIEKLDTMSTDSFVNALKRFESRRGKPEVIRSDNGTNFVGGERELRESVQAWNQQKISEHLRQREIEWIFNPPTASHMGGAWERQIRTVRKVMRALKANNRPLDDEGLSTLFCEVESIVNNRPITAVSDDPLDLKPLTPNHLLLLRSGMDSVTGGFTIAETYQKQWKHVQFQADQFWKRWIKEYLPTIQLRQKWLSPQQNLKEGDIVLICDEVTPRGNWPLGRILKVHSGQDGLVRSADVKTRSTVLSRPIHKLCPLGAV